MKPTIYKLKLSYDDSLTDLIVDHDPEVTGIDVEAEYDRWIEIGELERGSFMLKAEDFRNFLWSECGLLTLDTESD